MPGCRIRNWSKHFENSRSREIKSLDWVPIPNKMDGDGYTQLVDHPNAAAHLGAWLALVEIASRREERGALPYSGPQLARYLSRISRLPVEIFEEVLPRLEEIGWIEVIQQDTQIPQDADTLPPQDAGIPQDAAPRVRAQKRTEEKGIEENRTEARECAPLPSILLSEPGTEGWDELVAAGSRAHMSMDPDPQSDLCQKHWRRLAFDVRLAAVQGILARIECGQYEDPAFVPTLDNYLRGKKWRESLRPRSRGQPDKKQAAMIEFHRRTMQELANGTE